MLNTSVFLSQITVYVLYLITPTCLHACFSLKEGEDQKEIKIEPADAVEEVEPLPEDYYTRPINLTEGNGIGLWLVSCAVLTQFLVKKTSFNRD